MLTRKGLQAAYKDRTPKLHLERLPNEVISQAVVESGVSLQEAKPSVISKMKFQKWVPEGWRDQCRKLHEFSIQYAQAGDDITLFQVSRDLYHWLYKYSDLLDQEIPFDEWNEAHSDDFTEELDYLKTNTLAGYLDTALKKSPSLARWDALPPPEKFEVAEESHTNPKVTKSQSPSPSESSASIKAESEKSDTPPPDTSTRARRSKRQISVTELCPNGEDDNTAEGLKKKVKRLEGERDSLKAAKDELVEKVEDVYGGRGRLISSLINAASDSLSQNKRRRPSDVIMMRTLANYEKRLKEQEDQVSKCRYLVSVAKAYSEGRASIDETISILSDPKASPFQTQDIGVQVNIRSDQKTTPRSRKKQTLVSRETQTDQSCWPGQMKAKPQASVSPHVAQQPLIRSTTTPPVHVTATPPVQAQPTGSVWNALKATTSIQGHPWYQAIAPLSSDEAGGSMIIGKLPPCLAWKPEETALLNHVSVLIKHDKLATFQAIPIKLAIHLLEYKGMSTEDIAKVFDEIDGNRSLWTVKRVSRIAQASITHPKMGNVCGPV
ncbi:hypothetical protein M3P05_13195 [Sansalvadorimonas sp. 2012CJ34-2]|uniref:Uncharacterized protein n=1 Tax=Parendozoicomonas callyspongiae TaxID=2942213 RepID=A0ABT0PHN5_9GAMM|nr:hypothetical protein [Sansalvadorimonas sp. 2012CJ34-2]MCL6270879.1 hypothetical protein [Sansalvadorimonas sp. 2012CJ34-2]